MSQTLILIRGLPGSGKTTIAKRLIGAGFLHYEADQFFQYEDDYRFDAALLPEAHKRCLENTTQALVDGYDVVVSNTFTRNWEMAAYLDAAESVGACVHVMEACGDFKNVHGVPEEAIARMRSRYEPFGFPLMERASA